MKAKSLILSLLLLLPIQAQAQQTATYGTLVNSLNTASAGAVTGTAWAVPSSYAALIQWTVVADGGALSVNLMCSLDNSSYFVVDTQTTVGGGTKQFGFTACKFIRIDAVSRAGGTSTVGTLVTSRGFITSSSAGNLSSLNLSGGLTVTQGTLTADSQAISTTATWNNAGVTFTHWKANVTDTASAAASLLLDLQVGGASKFNVTKLGAIQLAAGTYLSPASNGVLTLTNSTFSDFSRLQFGGTTSSFPALKRNSTTLIARLADDSADANFTASVGLFAQINTPSGGGFSNNSVYFMRATAPTISSGFGTSPSIVASNGTAAFTINVGTGGVATGGVVGLPAAATGWACRVENLTANAANRANQRTLQQATTTTTVTIQNQTISTGAALAFTASDIVQMMCLAY